MNWRKSPISLQVDSPDPHSFPCACMCVLVCGSCNLCVLCTCCNVCPSSPLSPPVLTELRQANLITSEECKMQPPSDPGLFLWYDIELGDITDVVRVLKGKSPTMMSKAAEVLRRHGFEKGSRLLAGRQSRPSSICQLFECVESLSDKLVHCHYGSLTCQTLPTQSTARMKGLVMWHLCFFLCVT